MATFSLPPSALVCSDKEGPEGSVIQGCGRKLTAIPYSDRHGKRQDCVICSYCDGLGYWPRSKK